MKCYLMIGSAVIKVKFEIAHAQCLMGGSHCKATDLFNSYFPEWKPRPSRVKCLNLRMCHPIYYIDWMEWEYSLYGQKKQKKAWAILQKLRDGGGSDPVSSFWTGTTIRISQDPFIDLPIEKDPKKNISTFTAQKYQHFTSPLHGYYLIVSFYQVVMGWLIVQIRPVGNPNPNLKHNLLHKI